MSRITDVCCVNTPASQQMLIYTAQKMALMHFHIGPHWYSQLAKPQRLSDK